MSESSEVTIGFVPRDRFCIASRALEQLLEHTRTPYRLIIVDSDMPVIFRDQIESLVEGNGDTTILRTHCLMSSNGARNLVLQECRTDYVCLIENDVLVTEGWLDALIAACEEHPADVSAPLLLEPRGSADKVHFDDRLGRIKRQSETGKLEILPRETPLESDRGAARRETDFVEMHCILFSCDSLQRIRPFDEEQCGSRAEVDLSLALHAAGIRTVLEPSSRVTFLPPPPVHPEERAHYLRYWDIDGNAANHRTIESRWNLVECPSAMGFVAGRRRILDVADPDEQLLRFHEDIERQVRVAHELAEVVPETDLLILVDDGQWLAPDIAGPRPTLPFLEKDGQYWGSPSDDATAVAELERLRGLGARFLAVGWPAFWWLDHYQRFAEHLRDHYPCLLENERIVVFDLRD